MSMSMNKIKTSYMVTYTGDPRRVENFNTQKQKLSCLSMFEAADAVNMFQQCVDVCLAKKYCTEDFINKIVFDKSNVMYGCHGKLGHHASFLSLLESIACSNNDDNDWFLIVEDDIDFCSKIEQNLQQIVSDISDIETDYVRLWVDKREKIKRDQFNNIYMVKENIYQMIPQWGTVGQMITKRGAEIILSSTPIDVPLDIHISNLIKQLKATCVRDVLITNLGSDNATHKNSKLGSIIWKT